eukprot:TRINITY_DN19791_c0_g1_i1.p1 TRINITY_DN19791_c0_g1~~TRINITY_DN19791_c0_g1_i1.p1  ORF type:complete len:311 (-),score=79.15 TRINITY_DN19791_c0_g1_i1:31-825(-)
MYEKFRDQLEELDYEKLRQILKEQLTSLSFDPEETITQQIDVLLTQEYKILAKDIVQESQIPRLPTPPAYTIKIWRGDITLLAIDCIVNAANKYLLGCFTPNHKCIDNIIHCRAGPRLRAECRALVLSENNNKNEKTGRAKITRAYNLPSKYVLHTVGPIVSGHLTDDHQALLASSYRECLEKAKNVKAESIAFCCVSTGVFGFPQEPATKIALQTVKTWMDENQGVKMSVVFNVFTERDHQLYLGMWQDVFGTIPQAEEPSEK